MCECELRMKILLIFTLCLISDGRDSKEVTGYSGGGVLIKCTYDIKYKQNKKYFCKGSSPGCSDQIKTDAKDRWVSPGRYSMFDDTKSAEFRVMIRKLTVQDTDTYHCGVDQNGKDHSTRVQLKVIEDLSYKKFICETVHVGGDLNISCKYPESLTNKTKFLCKMELQDSVCSYNSFFDKSKKYVNIGESSLYDDRERQTLSVSIRNVTGRDSGEYWCGAEAAWESDDGYKVYFTQINLTVTDTHVPVSTLEPTQDASSSSSSSSSHSSSYSSFWTTSVSPATVSFLVFPAVIPVSVILLLLLIGILFLLVVLQKRRKIKAGRASSARRIVQSSANDNRISLEVCEYDEVKNNMHLSDPNAGISTVYSAVQSPTSPSDPSQTIYSNTLFPTSPCDSTVYSTPQSPRIALDQDIYCTA